MELDVGCREDVEVWECFSSPEIFELKVQCLLAHYRGAAPNRLCPFGLAGPIFEVAPRHLCCLSWRYKFFVHTATAAKKNINHCFHPGSAHACFLRMRRTFRVLFRTSPLGLRIVVEHP